METEETSAVLESCVTALGRCSAAIRELFIDFRLESSNKLHATREARDPPPPHATMDSVVGLTVWVKLKDRIVVYGVVEALTPGSHLTLRDGKYAAHIDEI